jgi:hypothetical protein
MSRFSRKTQKLARKGDVRGLLELSAKGRSERDGLAIRDAVRDLGSDAVAPQTELLGDPALRQKAALGLVDLGDAGGLRAVLRLAESDDEASQLKALFGLYAFARFEGTAEAFRELRRLAAESDFASVREMGTGLSNGLDQIVMERIQGLEALVDRLAAASSYPVDPKQLFRAAIAFKEITNPPTVRLAVQMLLDRAQEVNGVSMALTMIGEPAVRPTIEAIRAGRHGMAWPLLYLGHKYPEAHATLVQAAQSSPDPDVRAEASRVLDLHSRGRELHPDEKEIELLAAFAASVSTIHVGLKRRRH